MGDILGLGMSSLVTMMVAIITTVLCSLLIFTSLAVGKVVNQICIFLFGKVKTQKINARSVRGWGTSDGGIIITISVIFLLLSGWIWFGMDSDNRLSTQIQIFTASLGVLAASIAYKNYRRKSGSGLKANYRSSWSGVPFRPIQYVNKVTILNNKDRKNQISAIYLMINRKTPLLIQSYQDNPLILDAYSAREIEIPKPTAYLAGSIIEMDIDLSPRGGKHCLMLLTPEGPVEPDSLTDFTQAYSWEEKLITAYTRTVKLKNGELQTLPDIFCSVFTIEIANNKPCYLVVGFKPVIEGKLKPGGIITYLGLYDHNGEIRHFGGKDKNKVREILGKRYVDDADLRRILLEGKEYRLFLDEFYELSREDKKIVFSTQNKIDLSLLMIASDPPIKASDFL